MTYTSAISGLLYNKCISFFVAFSHIDSVIICSSNQYFKRL